MQKNASDEQQIANSKQKEKLSREKELNDLRFLLSTDQGRRFVWRYLEICGVYKSSFTGSSETFFLEGQRNIGLKLIADIMDADPEAYIKMQKQNREVLK